MSDEPEILDAPRRVNVPPLRQFEITRRSDKFDGNGIVQEVINVSAHIVEHAGANADLLVFYDYIIDPIHGPMTRAHRMLRGDTDLLEVTPAQSRLIQ